MRTKLEESVLYLLSRIDDGFGHRYEDALLDEIAAREKAEVLEAELEEELGHYGDPNE